mgnify:CR=1 FL=1
MDVKRLEIKLKNYISNRLAADDCINEILRLVEMSNGGMDERARLVRENNLHLFGWNK